MLLPLSVLISIYSNDHTYPLYRALSSITEGQCYMPAQIVVVKDGPLPFALEFIINSFVSKFPHIFTIVSYNQNRGLSYALNHGLLYCKYDIVARMDADDISHPFRFLHQYEYLMNNKKVDIFGGFATIVSYSGSYKTIRTAPVGHKNIRRLVWACPFNHPTVAFRKMAILGVGGYNINLPSRQDDYELWIRSAFRGLIFANTTATLIDYRLSIASKNTISVGLHRLLIGFYPAIRFDPSIRSVFGVMYPLIRSLTPSYFLSLLNKVSLFFDPRKP